MHCSCLITEKLLKNLEGILESLVFNKTIRTTFTVIVTKRQTAQVPKHKLPGNADSLHTQQRHVSSSTSRFPLMQAKTSPHLYTFLGELSTDDYNNSLKSLPTLTSIYKYVTFPHTFLLQSLLGRLAHPRARRTIFLLSNYKRIKRMKTR